MSNWNNDSTKDELQAELVRLERLHERNRSKYLELQAKVKKLQAENKELKTKLGKEQDANLDKSTLHFSDLFGGFKF